MERSVLESLRNCDGHVQVDKGFSLPDERPITLGYQMLGPQTCQEYRDKMKDPLRLALQELGKGGIFSYYRKLKAVWDIFRVCKLWLVPTKENCTYPNSLVLLDIKEWFFAHLARNKNTPLYMIGAERAEMFNSAWNMFINVYEHVAEWHDFFDAIVEKLVSIYNSGGWEKKQEGRPIPRFWRE